MAIEYVPEEVESKLISADWSDKTCNIAGDVTVIFGGAGMLVTKPDVVIWSVILSWDSVKTGAMTLSIEMDFDVLSSFPSPTFTESDTVR